MIIANPIYDAVFKYLMQNEEAAKLLLSAIIEMTVLELEFKPQELVSQVQYLSIYRVDFKAKVKTKEGKTLVVLIELQKVKFYTSTLRFRRYLAEQYASEDNMRGNEGIPILTIYILGHYLEKYKNEPIVRIKRQYISQEKKELKNGLDSLIESLTHDSIFIQLPVIKKRKKSEKRSELEKVLSIFELSNTHKVEVNEREYPEGYFSVLRILREAIMDHEMSIKMKMEDEILKELKIRESDSLVKERKLAKLETELEEKEKLLEGEKKRAEEEKKRAEEEKKRAEENLQKVIELAKMLKSMGVDAVVIAEKTGLTIEEIEKI
jgi:predicted transposase/invertase (TIGR01784 family)